VINRVGEPSGQGYNVVLIELVIMSAVCHVAAGFAAGGRWLKRVYFQ